ncbi:MAG: anti-sigma factor [Gaiellaceae bacterium]
MNERPPDFDELIGPEVDEAERDRLRRVHDLLVAAGPPPDVANRSAPAVGPIPLLQRRRRRVLLALAAALGVIAAFTIGLAVAESDDPSADRIVAMSGPAGASASLEIFEVDAAGNWPMLVEVAGLPPARDGRLFQLWLTKDGMPAALCGSFLARADGTAVVPMNAPWPLDDFDGWVVVEAGSEKPVLTT